jgi:hypothetical protein
MSYDVYPRLGATLPTAIGGKKQETLGFWKITTYQKKGLSLMAEYLETRVSSNDTILGQE